MADRSLQQAAHLQVGTRLRELRTAQQIALRRFAKFRISRGHLRNIECGRNVPSLSVIERIAEVLEISPVRLLAESNGDLLLEDPFIRAVYPFARRLSAEQRQHLLRIFRAIGGEPEP